MLSEVIAEVQRVLDLIATARRHLRGALARLDETSVGYATTFAGSAASDSAQSMACLAEAREHTVAGLAAADRSADLLATYLGVIAGGRSSVVVSQDRPVRRGRVDLPAHVRHADVVRDVRTRLGRGVRGRETRGTWLHADGRTEDIRSGLDTPWFRRAKAIFSGFGNLRYTRLARHCEGQAVVRMQKEQLRKATIILDRAPCGTPPNPVDEWTCDQKLDDIMYRLLPAGSVLTVIDPDGTLWTYPKEERS